MAKNFALMCGFLVIAALLAPVSSSPCFASEESHSSSEATDFPPDLQEYHDAGQSLPARLAGRIEANPFNLVGTVIFLLAILHTFFSSKILNISNRLEEAHQRRIEAGTAPLNSVSHSARLLHFLGGLSDRPASGFGHQSLEPASHPLGLLLELLLLPGKTLQLAPPLGLVG